MAAVISTKRVRGNDGENDRGRSGSHLRRAYLAEDASSVTLHTYRRIAVTGNGKRNRAARAPCNRKITGSSDNRQIGWYIDRLREGRRCASRKNRIPAVDGRDGMGASTKAGGAVGSRPAAKRARTECGAAVHKGNGAGGRSRKVGAYADYGSNRSRNGRSECHAGTNGTWIRTRRNRSRRSCSIGRRTGKRNRLLRCNRACAGIRRGLLMWCLTFHRCGMDRR